jgi:hypothetical protein
MWFQAVVDRCADTAAVNAIERIAHSTIRAICNRIARLLSVSGPTSSATCSANVDNFGDGRHKLLLQI